MEGFIQAFLVGRVPGWYIISGQSVVRKIIAGDCEALFRSRFILARIETRMLQAFRNTLQYLHIFTEPRFLSMT
jgi:hypothetical protein